jgi:hypothetical protein
MEQESEELYVNDNTKHTKFKNTDSNPKHKTLKMTGTNSTPNMYQNQLQ